MLTRIQYIRKTDLPLEPWTLFMSCTNISKSAACYDDSFYLMTDNKKTPADYFIWNLDKCQLTTHPSSHFKPLSTLLNIDDYGYPIKGTDHYIPKDSKILGTDRGWYFKDEKFLFCFIWKSNDRFLHLYGIPKSYQRLAKYSHSFLLNNKHHLNKAPTFDILKKEYCYHIKGTDFELPPSAKLLANDYMQKAYSDNEHVLIRKFDGSYELYGPIKDFWKLDDCYKDYIVFIFWLIKIPREPFNINYYVPKILWLKKIFPEMLAYIK